jgi:hypothetical protein
MAIIRLLVALLITIAVGIVSRLYPIGYLPYDKSLGDALYAVAAYLGIALLLFRKPRLLVAALALVWCLAVEAFQATGIPARHADLWIVRWVIGTEFSWHDVACYFIGVAAAIAVDMQLLRRNHLTNPAPAP